MVVLYDVEGAEVWHERLITARDAGRPGTYAVLTPDYDHYVEELTMTSVDVAGLRALDHQGAVPRGLVAERIYRFQDVPAGQEYRQLLRDGALMLGVPLVQVELPVVPPRGVLPRIAAGRAAAVAGHVWVVVEDVEGYRRGEIVEELGEDAVIMGTKCLMPLENGDVAIVRSMPRAAVMSYINDDLRVLPVKFEAGGRRHRPFAEAVDLLSEDEPQGGLMLEGPASVMWLAQSRRDGGGNFAMGHEHWVRTANISAGDRSVYEHEVLSRVLDSMLCTDQLNLPALQSAELAHAGSSSSRRRIGSHPGRPTTRRPITSWGGLRGSTAPRSHRVSASMLPATSGATPPWRRKRERRPRRPSFGRLRTRREESGARAETSLAPRRNDRVTNGVRSRPAAPRASSALARYVWPRGCSGAWRVDGRRGRGD